MARSYKKNPWCKDGNRRKKRDKQIANRKIRRGGWSGKEIPSGGKYRQLSCSYDICDHRWSRTFAEYIRNRQRWYVEWAIKYGIEDADRFVALDWREAYRNWARDCLWK